MQAGKQQGFTLIELMVVLVIIGIASAAVGLSIKPDPLQLLRKDAERLAQLLQVAQAEARADGRPITWRATAKGLPSAATANPEAASMTCVTTPNCAPGPGKPRRCKCASNPGSAWY